MDLNARRNLSYGLYVVSSMDGGRPVGCIANSAMQIMAEPASIAVSLNHDNFTTKCVEKTGKFAISVLSEQAAPSLIAKFGFRSSKNTDKFQEVPYEKYDGMPVLKECCTYVNCQVTDKMETETHTVFLGSVIDTQFLKEGTPMTYAYYHNVVKGKSPKTAPTYIPPSEKTKGAYICTVCGYIYDGEVPFENLPEDYVCPICLKPKSAFKKEE